MSTAITTINNNIEVAKKATQDLQSYFGGIPELNVLANQSSALLRDAAEITVIESNEQYTEAAEIISCIDDVSKQIKQIIDPYVGFANQVHKAMVAISKEYGKDSEDEKKRLKRALGVYQEKLERERREREAAMAAKARKEAEEKALAESLRLQAEGKSEEAERNLTEAIAAPAPVVMAPVELPKAEGVVLRTTWKFRIIDKSKLPAEYLIPDETAIGQLVRSMKNNAPALLNGAIEVYSERG